MSYSTLSRGLSVVAFAALAAPLSAQTTFDFSNLGNPGNGPQFLPTNGQVCTGSDRCGTLGGPLSFSKGLFAVDAYGFYNGGAAVVVQDAEGGYNGNDDGMGTIGAGLGVYHTGSNANADGYQSGFITSDDNITSGEMLKLDFGEIVTMNWVGLRSEGHNFISWDTGDVFEYSTDNSTWINALLPDGTGQFTFAAPLVSQHFYFRFATTGQANQYYLSAANVSGGDPFQVPEPASVALLGLGVFSLGVVSRRRKSAHATS